MIKILRYRTTLLLSLLPALLSCSSGLSIDEDGAGYYRSAQITGRRSSLENQIRFPDYQGDISIVLNCYGIVSMRGDIGMRFCDSSNEDKNLFVRAVYGSSSTSRMATAKVGASEEEVMIMFSVLFEQAGEEQSIEVFMHHLLDDEPHEADYIAPQRVVIYTSRWNLGTSPCATGDFAHWMNVRVSTEGEPLEISLKEKDEGANEECIEYSHDYLSNQTYIPAVQNGERVEATYTEVFNEGFRRVFDIN